MPELLKIFDSGLAINGNTSIDKIAKETNQDISTVIEKIQKLIVEFQAAHPTPPPR